MARLELTLHTKDGEETYKQEHVSGQKYLDLLNMDIEFNEKLGIMTRVEQIEKQLDYIAGLFDNTKVTAQYILEGTDSWDVEPMIDRIMGIVLGVDSGDEKKEQSL